MEETNNTSHIAVTPFVDFSMQFSLAKNNERVERCIFESLQELAREVAFGKQKSLGSIVVLGDFEKFGPQIDGMVQMKPKQNPVESLRIFDSTHGAAYIKEFSISPFDGAMIVDKTGQIIGAGVYLVVEDPTLDTPEDCGTRHKAAASFSRREDVISVLTLSEETNTVRIWQHGKVKEVYRTNEVVAEEKEEKATKKKKGAANKTHTSTENEE
jgi:DNA integrity scanning protein DisA with diadenylate cyclase activity